MYARKDYDKNHTVPAYNNERKAGNFQSGNARQQARAEVRAELAALEI